MQPALSLLKQLKQKGKQMKKIDIKSVIIGILGTILVFVSIGATNQNKNLGHIIVNSIRVVNNDGKVVAGLKAGEDGGMLGIFNNDSKTVAAMLKADEDGGRLDILNNDGKTVAGLNADEDGGTLGIANNDGKVVAMLNANEDGRRLVIFNNDGKVVAVLNAGENGGMLDIYNKHEKKVATLQSDKFSDGLIVLYDRYGDIGWGETGKQ